MERRALRVEYLYWYFEYPILLSTVLDEETSDRAETSSEGSVPDWTPV